MMTYEMPKLTMICEDRTARKKLPSELYYWELDREAGEVVISCCFERIESWEYLAGSGKPVISRYIEELEDKDCFRRLKESVEICRVECDVDEGDSVLELNRCEPWQFPVRNEPRWDPIIEEYMEEELEEFNACDREALFSQCLAVRKDGLWWIVSLEEPVVWEKCFRRLEPLNDLYCEGLLVGESIEGIQYGLFFNGYDDKYINLQGDEWDEDAEMEEPWSRISHVDGNLVLLERYCDGEVVARRLVDEFERVIAEDTLEDLRNGDGFTMMGHPVSWVECRGEVMLIDVRDHLPFSRFTMLPIEILGKYQVMDSFGLYRVLARDGAGPGRYHLAVNQTFLAGDWDDAQIIGANWDNDAQLFCVKKDGLWGIVDSTGEVVVPLRFMKIRELGFDGDDVLVELDSFEKVRRGRLHMETCLEDYEEDPVQPSEFWADGWWNDRQVYRWELQLKDY